MVTNNLRPFDFVTRMGGEEFVVIMPEADISRGLPRSGETPTTPESIRRYCRSRSEGQADANFRHNLHRLLRSAA